MKTLRLRLSLLMLLLCCLFASPMPAQTAADATPAQGTFTWLDDRTMQWTPTQFFPAHAPIDVSVGGFATSFETGSSVVGVADLDAHTFTVSIDGVVAREIPLR